MANDPKPVPFFERFFQTVAPQYALQRAVARDRLVQFGYDAANPGTKRGSSGGMSKNASSETPQMGADRIKLIWEARDLERNMPIIRGALDRVAQYVCAQLMYQSQSDDPNYDSVAEAYWQDWCEHTADVTGRFNLRMLMEIGFRSMLRDGDFGFHLVRNGSELQLQMIEADRIGDPNKVATIDDPNLIQGIKVNDLGQPVGYDIYKRDRKSLRYEFEMTAEPKNFFLLARHLRSDEYRGTSWLAPVVAQARDLYESFGFERGAAKWASSIAGVIKVADPLAMGGAGSAGLWDGKSRDANGNPTEVVEGNKLLRLRPNEDVTPFNTGNRPSGAFQAYIETTLRDIAFGLNVPYGFFDMSKFGGATVRLEAQQLQRTFARFQELIVTSVLNPIKRAVLSNAIALGKLPPTANFAAGRWQFGKHLTADTGYDTNANIQLLQNGLKSAAAIAGEEGYDYEDLVGQLVKEATLMRDACSTAGLPMELIAQARFPDATNQLSAAASAMEPDPAPTLATMGDSAVKTLNELLEKVALGTMPREEVVATLIEIYEMDPLIAEALVPETGVTEPPPPVVAPGGGAGGGSFGKPKAQAIVKKPAKVDSKK